MNRQQLIKTFKQTIFESVLKTQDVFDADEPSLEKVINLGEELGNGFTIKHGKFLLNVLTRNNECIVPGEKGRSIIAINPSSGEEEKNINILEIEPKDDAKCDNLASYIASTYILGNGLEFEKYIESKAKPLYYISTKIEGSSLDECFKQDLSVLSEDLKENYMGDFDIEVVEMALFDCIFTSVVLGDKSSAKDILKDLPTFYAKAMRIIELAIDKYGD